MHGLDEGPVLLPEVASNCGRVSIYATRCNRVEVGEMKWDLDLWYELWDKAGSQGLDTWYDLRGEVRDLPDTGHTPDAGPDVIEDGREGI
jgi:hypothetical protein